MILVTIGLIEFVSVCYSNTCYTRVFTIGGHNASYGNVTYQCGHDDGKEAGATRAWESVMALELALEPVLE